MIAVLILAAVIIGYFVVTYNQFQTIKTRIKASIQEIGNQLKRQASLIPNLVSSAKGYLEHEKGIYDKITDARKAVDDAVDSGDTDKMLAAQGKIQKLLGSLRILVESNPEIKGSQVVSKLMEELRDTADKIMYSRRTLIDLTADFNRMIVTIPTNFVAKIAGFRPEEGLKTATSGEHLEVSTQETKTPKADLN